jgi:catalase
MLRDGFHQQAVHAGVAPYRPNSLDGGNPFEAGDAENAFVDVPVRVAEAPKIRANPASFDDHYSQVRLFWLSMTPVEKQHIINAYTFELNKCYEQVIKERQLLSLANIDPVLCQQVATGLGLPAPEPTVPLAEVAPSPALSQVGGTWPPDGRMVGIVVDPAGDLSDLDGLRRAIFGAGLVPLLIGPHGGLVGGLPVQRTFATARSVEFDAILLAGAPVPAPDALPARDAKGGAPGSGAVDPRVVLLVDEAWRHAKTIGAWGAGVAVLQEAGVAGTPGVVTAETGENAFAAVLELLGAHRVWERFPATIA